MAKNGTNLSYSPTTLSSAVDMVAKQTCFLQLYLFCLTKITNFRSLQESVVWSLADQTIWPARREVSTESLPLILSIYGDMLCSFTLPPVLGIPWDVLCSSVNRFQDQTCSSQDLTLSLPRRKACAGWALPGGEGGVGQTQC